jgi:predicted ABC-class ATPase
MQQLKQCLSKLQNQSYKAYKSLQHTPFHFDGFDLLFNHVQGDPFAEPSKVSLIFPFTSMQFPNELYATEIRKIAFEDFLRRHLFEKIKNIIKGIRGTGKSGLIEIEQGGQQVIQRNAVQIHQDRLEIRLMLALPANGRRILLDHAKAMLLQEIPAIAAECLWSSLDQVAAVQQVESVEDQVALRDSLSNNNLVAFIANDSVLPRISGIEDTPLSDAITFTSPASLQVSISLPNKGVVTGMGIKQGITLFVGGGFHGKSTVLSALQTGVYNHIPTDGREAVVTLPDAVKVKAEDGRQVNQVTIQPFIDNLPLNKDTKCFSSNNASGSTSQASSIIEALQANCKLLLIDEDTSATNFMIRDEKMQALVADEKEPITPLLHRIRDLYEQYGISSVLVMGGSGDYFSVADTVLMLDTYQIKDVTAEAKSLAATQVCQAKTELKKFMPELTPRALGFPAILEIDKLFIKHKHRIDLADFSIDLRDVEQLMEISQTRAIGWLIKWTMSQQTETSIFKSLTNIYQQVASEGFDKITPYPVGNLAMPRLIDVFAAVNRIR